MAKNISTSDENQEALSQQELKLLELKLEQELYTSLTEVDENTVISSDTGKQVTLSQFSQIVERLARIKDVDRSTIILGISTLFRKGAANAGAPDTMELDLKCPVTNQITTIARYDIVTVLHNVTGHKTVRKLAETMAPHMIKANLQKLKTNPMQDLRGDLANRIDRKLVTRNEPTLTRKEQICCATYAQWLPNLNELAESERLASLLNEDLNARRKKKSASGKKGTTKTPPPAPKAGKKQGKKTPPAPKAEKKESKKVPKTPPKD